MSDLKRLESEQIAKLSEMVYQAEAERDSALLARDRAIRELEETKSNIDDLASVAAKKVWADERAMLLGKISRLEREIRKNKCAKK